MEFFEETNASEKQEEDGTNPEPYVHCDRYCAIDLPAS
jgi:hypothetical protein